MFGVNINSNYYSAFGLTISSEIAMPELSSIPEPPSLACDVKIRYYNFLVEFMSHGNYENEAHCFFEHDKAVYFKVEDVALFRISGGSLVEITPLSGADHNKIKLYTLGTCMGTILIQRGILPLHGSAVVIDGKAYAIVGESGAGKSTLAAVFVQREFPLVTDDVIPVTLPSGSNVPMVTPSYPQQKLWGQSLSYMEMDASQYTPLFHETTKYGVPSTRFVDHQVPLAGIIELIKDQSISTPLHRVAGLHALPLIFQHTYRNFLIPLLGLQQWHFSTAAQLSGKLDIYRVIRNESSFTPHHIADQILSEVSKGALIS